MALVQGGCREVDLESIPRLPVARLVAKEPHGVVDREALRIRFDIRINLGELFAMPKIVIVEKATHSPIATVSPRFSAIERPRFSCSITRMPGKLSRRWDAVPSEPVVHHDDLLRRAGLGENASYAFLYIGAAVVGE